LRSLPSDLANLLFLVAPLALLAPLFAGRERLAAWSRRPETRLAIVAALPLAVLAAILPIAPSGLGVHRDWDLSALFGWTLTLAAVMLLARVPLARLRAALAWSLPVLALTAGGWLAVNADRTAAVMRADAIVTKPPALADAQRSQALLYLSRWATFEGRTRDAARYFEQSYDLTPTPNRGLLAAYNWANNREWAAARRMIARVRARGGLDSMMIARADTIESQIERAEAAAPRAR
jgi:hypothetical protein